MARESVDDLIAFLAVAREQSFTRAAAQLGVSQPALSQTIRTLEHRLGVRLLTRTTRSVSTTEAGERSASNDRPALRWHRSGIGGFERTQGQAGGKPAHHLGRACLTDNSRARDGKAPARLSRHTVEIINDYGLTDIVADRFDAGVRLGEQVAQDMIAVRIGPDFEQVVVGAPSYFKKRASQKRRMI